MEAEEGKRGRKGLTGTYARMHASETIDAIFDPSITVSREKGIGTHDNNPPASSARPRAPPLPPQSSVYASIAFQTPRAAPGTSAIAAPFR